LTGKSSRDDRTFAAAVVGCVVRLDVGWAFV